MLVTVGVTRSLAEGTRTFVLRELVQIWSRTRKEKDAPWSQSIRKLQDLIKQGASHRQRLV